MTKGIEHGLFARLMLLPTKDRQDVLEFLGQSPVSAERFTGPAAGALAARRHFREEADAHSGEQASVRWEEPR